MRKVLFTLVLALPMLAFSQWKSAALGTSEIKEGKELIEYSKMYTLNLQTFQEQLADAPERFSDMQGVLLRLPNVEGKMERYKVWEASNFASALQAKFPEIRSYIGIGIDDPHAYLRLSVAPQGISTITLRAGGSEFIEPYTVNGDKYVVFNSKTHRNAGEIPFECSTPATAALANDLEDLVSANKSSVGVFKTFRLAQSVTGEYSQYFGGTMEGAMAAINATMTRVNGVFEKDLALNLILVDNNEEVVYLDPSTDPYTNPTNINTTQNQLNSTLNSVIGADNYDIGHIFHRTGGGGNAGCIGCVCSNNQKGRGYTSPGTGGPEGDNFDIDYVAHEMGHQLGANHVFSHSTEGTGVNVEPGSGSTIMSYAGITNYNVQAHSDDYFNNRSVNQIQVNLQGKPCANDTPITGNTTPTVYAGAQISIPKGTAFKLTAEAEDADGDPLLYNWEQRDSGTNATTGANSRVSFNKAAGPNFRSNPHLESATRYFPAFNYVLNIDVTENENYWRSRWEAVAGVVRNYNFVVTVRDNNPAGPQTAMDNVLVRVRDAGPFKISNIETNQEIPLESGTMEVQWDVAGTNEDPIGTEFVRILLSTDGGSTFTVVSESTPNTGSKVISFPQGTVAASNARIMIEAIDNIYYCVSRNFSLTGTMNLIEIETFKAGIYPNPNKGEFFVRANKVSKGEVKTIIYDTTGRLMHTQKINHMGGFLNQTVNVNLPMGVYVVVIDSEDGQITEKLIIK